MTIGPWPNPIPGQNDQVVLDQIPLQLVPGKYSIEEADRFGEKVSQGTLKYADFNPYESAFAVASLVGGSGLRRYSDAGDDPTQFATLYTESSNVNCAFTPVVLSPEISYGSLPGSNGPAQWIGEDVWLVGTTYNRRVLAVAPTPGGTGVYQMNSPTSWSQLVTIGRGPPLGPAIGIFGDRLIIGFGAAGLAVTVDRSGVVRDVTGLPPQNPADPGGPPSATPVGLYVWAYTNDHAQNIIAGGPNTDDFTKVWSSVDVSVNYQLPVETGGTPIVSLAPGGGLVSVYVGKIDELGMIDLSSTQVAGSGTVTGLQYHSLLPFDTLLTSNANPLKWLLASGTDQARGSLTLVFPRDRSLWEYAPADQFSGTASEIAPWAVTYRRPPNARGVVRAIQGTSRFLYYAVENGAGHTWIYRNDQTSGAPHTYLDLGTVAVRAMAAIFPGDPSFPTNPLLMFSAGNNIGSVVLPLDGTLEIDDPNCRFQSVGHVDIPDIDLGFPDEDKIGFEVRVIADNLSAGHRFINVQYMNDGVGPWQTMQTIASVPPFGSTGTQVNVSPSETVYFPLNDHFKRVRLRIELHTDDPSQTPMLWGFSLRAVLNTRVFRLFVFQARIPAGSLSTLADDLQNPYLILEHFWNARRDGTQIGYLDPWNDSYLVRLIKLQQQQALREPDRTPEWVLDFTLIEFRSSFLLQGAPAPALAANANGHVPSYHNAEATYVTC